MNYFWRSIAARPGLGRQAILTAATPRQVVIMATTFRAAVAAYAASAVVLLALAASQVHLGAQSSEQTLYVSVLDRNGAPVTDLGPGDITVREGAARREVLRVSRAVEPIDIALLVDDSQAAEPHLIHIRPALSRFVQLMQQEHNIAIVGLAQRPTIFTDYTRDPKRLAAAIGRVFPQSSSGMTLLDALVEVSRGLQKREAPRAALVAMITNGPEQGRYDDRTVVETLRSGGAAFYAVSVGTFTDIAPEEHRYRNIVLERGTRATGGRHVNLMAASGLPEALAAVARELSSQLKVVYSRPGSLIQADSAEVSVTRPGLTARATASRGAGGQR
jgi:VWFA-related protein